MLKIATDAQWVIVHSFYLSFIMNMTFTHSQNTTNIINSTEVLAEQVCWNHRAITQLWRNDCC